MPEQQPLPKSAKAEDIEIDKSLAYRREQMYREATSDADLASKPNDEDKDK